MIFSDIYFWEPSFKRVFSKTFWKYNRCRYRSLYFQYNLEDMLWIIFYKLGNRQNQQYFQSQRYLEIKSEVGRYLERLGKFIKVTEWRGRPRLSRVKQSDRNTTINLIKAFISSKNYLKNESATRYNLKTIYYLNGLANPLGFRAIKIIKSSTQ